MARKKSIIKKPEEDVMVERLNLNDEFNDDPIDSDGIAEILVEQMKEDLVEMDDDAIDELEMPEDMPEVFEDPSFEIDSDEDDYGDYIAGPEYDDEIDIEDAFNPEAPVGDIEDEDEVVYSNDDVDTDTETGDRLMSNADKVIDMSKVNFGKESEVITRSVRDSFNPTETQNGLLDSDTEGGLYVVSTTNDNDDNSGGVYSGITKTVSGKVELSGFQVKTKANDVFNVVAAFDSIEDAKESIQGSKFFFVDKGALVIADIINGKPSISNDEVELAIYIKGVWQRP